MMPRFRIVVSLGGLLAALAASGATAIGLQPSGTAAVSVTLSEWKLIPSVKSVPAGKIRFRVKNAGALEHELVVLRTDTHHHALPVKGGKAVETGALGGIEDMQPGETRSVTLRLKPGRYVLFCNLLGHYRAGQFAALRVR